MLRNKQMIIVSTDFQSGLLYSNRWTKQMEKRHLPSCTKHLVVNHPFIYEFFNCLCYCLLNTSQVSKSTKALPAYFLMSGCTRNRWQQTHSLPPGVASLTPYDFSEWWLLIPCTDLAKFKWVRFLIGKLSEDPVWQGWTGRCALALIPMLAQLMPISMLLFWHLGSDPQWAMFSWETIGKISSNWTDLPAASMGAAEQNNHSWAWTYLLFPSTLLLEQLTESLYVL